MEAVSGLFFLISVDPTTGQFTTKAQRHEDGLLSGPMCEILPILLSFFVSRCLCGLAPVSPPSFILNHEDARHELREQTKTFEIFNTDKTNDHHGFQIFIQSTLPKSLSFVAIFVIPLTFIVAAFRASLVKRAYLLTISRASFTSRLPIGNRLKISKSSFGLFSGISPRTARMTLDK